RFALRTGGNRGPAALSACAPRPVGKGDAGRILRPRGAGRGARRRRPAGVRLMQKPVMKAAPTLSAADFFARVRERLTLETPTGLNDPNIVPKRGDHDVDPVMEKIALVRPVRPAAVLIPVVEHAEPTV